MSSHRPYRDVQVKTINWAAEIQLLSFHALMHSEPPENGRLRLGELKADLMKGLSIVSSCQPDWQIASWAAQLQAGATGEAGLVELSLTCCYTMCGAGGQSPSVLTEIPHRTNYQAW